MVSTSDVTVATILRRIVDTYAEVIAPMAKETIGEAADLLEAMHGQAILLQAAADGAGSQMLSVQKDCITERKARLAAESALEPFAKHGRIWRDARTDISDPVLIRANYTDNGETVAEAITIKTMQDAASALEPGSLLGSEIEKLKENARLAIDAGEEMIKTLTEERDANLEELGRVIMACPPGYRAGPASDGVKKMRADMEARQVAVKDLEWGDVRYVPDGPWSQTMLRQYTGHHNLGPFAGSYAIQEMEPGGAWGWWNTWTADIHYPDGVELTDVAAKAAAQADFATRINSVLAQGTPS